MTQIHPFFFENRFEEVIRDLVRMYRRDIKGPRWMSFPRHSYRKIKVCVDCDSDVESFYFYEPEDNTAFRMERIQGKIFIREEGFVDSGKSGNLRLSLPIPLI